MSSRSSGGLTWRQAQSMIKSSSPDRASAPNSPTTASPARVSVTVEVPSTPAAGAGAGPVTPQQPSRRTTADAATSPAMVGAATPRSESKQQNMNWPPPFNMTFPAAVTDSDDKQSAPAVTTVTTAVAPVPQPAAGAVAAVPNSKSAAASSTSAGASAGAAGASAPATAAVPDRRPSLLAADGTKKPAIPVLASDSDSDPDDYDLSDIGRNPLFPSPCVTEQQKAFYVIFGGGALAVFVVVPCVLSFLGQLDGPGFAAAFVFATAPPVSLLYYVYRNQEHFPHTKQFGILFATGHYFVMEMWQLILTLVGVVSYLIFLYNLSINQEQDLTSATGWKWVYNENVGPAWGAVEYFVVLGYGIDLFGRFVSAPNLMKFILNYHTLIDLLQFIGTGYSTAWRAAFSSTHYNGFLFQGPLRFLRLNRVFAPLERARGGKELNLRFIVVSAKTAALALFAIRIVIYICVCASVMTFAEYPCEADSFSNCKSEYKQFHTTLYFIIVTLSTVGYGDITPGSNFGRMLVVIIIVFGLISVPLQLNKVVAIITPPAQESAMERQVRELHGAIVAQQQEKALAALSEEKTASEHSALAQQLRERRTDAGVPASVAAPVIVAALFRPSASAAASGVNTQPTAAL